MRVTIVDEIRQGIQRGASLLFGDFVAEHGAAECMSDLCVQQMRRVRNRLLEQTAQNDRAGALAGESVNHGRRVDYTFIHP
ncbi:Uncharacterised protein [Mycobacterium tuberculosis]|uniref:Uncharacterized protein n=1 Tax=Mycobacterium tuberculosis TaxID=1773 RepID=A0A654ZQL1_MYCTX|nr:Uncharacterised protein [Mycobacterium tuberculosis]CKV07492.1 Uncharacterised protein [Mycobacterium tuberculosis]COY70894.1 Uncharacterised protein [Mycobacterium tuberculosis]